MSLRLVTNEPTKAPAKRRKWTRSQLFTPEEEQRLRAAMRGLQGAFGSWTCLAAAMDTNTDALRRMMRGASHVSGDVIVRAMKASGLALAELLGGPVAADRCRACGRVRAA